MSEQRNKSRWTAPLGLLKRELGMLLFIVVGSAICMPFILAIAWSASKLPDWLFWGIIILFWLGVLLQDSIKAAWRALRGAKP